MKLTLDNINDIPIKNRERLKIAAILNSDIPDIQSILKNKLNIDDEVYIDWQDYHDDCDEYPDYYGYYRICFRGETIGVEMTIDELDQNTCSLVNLLELI